jgi:predicted nuclease with TOPRIM domain
MLISSKGVPLKQKKGAIVKEEKSGQVQKLKNRIKNLEKKNRLLVTKLNSAEAALKDNMKYLKDHTEDLTLEDLIEAASSKKTLVETKKIDICPKCGSEDLKVITTLFGTMESCICGYRETFKK